jgi:hypothetical protein
MASRLLKQSRMNPTSKISKHSNSSAVTPNFWQRFLDDDALNHCSDLEKLVAGCELIAACDSVELLLAA